MFKSLQEIGKAKKLPINRFMNFFIEKTNITNGFIYKIIDDDFEEEITIYLKDYMTRSWSDPIAVMKLYEEKKLDVAKNLIVYFKYKSYDYFDYINSKTKFTSSNNRIDFMINAILSFYNFNDDDIRKSYEKYKPQIDDWLEKYIILL